MSTTPEEAQGEAVQVTHCPVEPDVGYAPDVDVHSQPEAEYRVAPEDHRGLDVRRELEVAPVQKNTPAERESQGNEGLMQASTPATKLPEPALPPST